MYSMLKKAVLIGTLAIISLPLVANADLLTDNNTDKYSSAEAYFPPPTPPNCSGMIGVAGITAPGEKNHTTSSKDVKALCNLAVPCNAYVIVETSQSAALGCSGTIIATATISDFNTDVVTKITPVAGAAYSVSGVGTNHIVISKN
jgi:hypothetical protein